MELITTVRNGLMKSLKQLKNLVVSLDSGGGPIITYAIIALCTYIHFIGHGWAFALVDIPSSLWTLVAYQITHPTFEHLFGNMLFLMLFGPSCEEYLGHFKYLIFLIICGVFSAIGLTLVWPNAQIVGASSAIAGLLAIFPLVQKRWFARVVSACVCLVYFWLQITYSIADFQVMNAPGVAHFAHVLGGVVGLIMYCIFHQKNKVLQANAA